MYDGRVTVPYVEQNAPPSSYAIADALEGVPGAWPRVGGLTAWRSVVISPGLYLAGIRGWKLVGGSLLGSAAISVYLLAYYGLARGRMQRQARPT